MRKGYMADSSWHRNPSGGRKYHLDGGDGFSRCGRSIICLEHGRKWDKIAKILRCKSCESQTRTNDDIRNEDRPIIQTRVLAGR